MVSANESNEVSVLAADGILFWKDFRWLGQAVLLPFTNQPKAEGPDLGGRNLSIEEHSQVKTARAVTVDQQRVEPTAFKILVSVQSQP